MSMSNLSIFAYITPYFSFIFFALVASGSISSLWILAPLNNFALALFYILQLCGKLAHSESRRQTPTF
jgi:hypothetical protein